MLMLNSGAHKLRTLDLFSSLRISHLASRIHRHFVPPPLSLTQTLTTQSSSQPTNLYLYNSTRSSTIRTTPTYTSIQYHRQKAKKATQTANTKDETPHPQLPHLRPQSLQTRNCRFSPAPPRRRTRTRRPRLESRVFGQCVAEIRLEGHQEFS